jgi:hypothetical protein
VSSFIRGGETVLIKRRTQDGLDEFGNPAWVTHTVKVRDCLIAFGASDEPAEADRDPIDTSLTLYMPPGTTVEPGDVFHLRATDFVKDGNPEGWVSPFDGFPLGVVLKLRRRSG